MSDAATQSVEAAVADEPGNPDSTVEYGGLHGSLRHETWTMRSRTRLLTILLSALPLAALQISLVWVPRVWWTIPGLWHRLSCRILGVQVTEHGKRVRNKGVLYVANHISWLDILVLGAVLKRSSFVAKAEISEWGVLGLLAKMQRTVFVNRERRLDSARQRDALHDRLTGGDSLIMFPEGTSTDGMRVGRFKSALFSVAEREEALSGKPLTIQPITLAFTEVNGMPWLRALKPWAAWLGDVELVSHVGHLLSKARLRVTIEYHPPVSLGDFEDRKALARYCENRIRLGLERANKGTWLHP
ncbi:lysophospholipid acyltransferase family protein [Eilatimonas milleporae]|uniref:1-acyl-sn-glycerol-3-phosphate acyltransferase n=1 Tax=Eilatimonas milleporae TaxID=911205 RepID=A0A3M0BZC7_9PROT|nr:lysophospholipid acyltransferase family protein [Eilatimonas milleporae]RMB02848.1 1-acyl-sn-glycerol-3-phosphate acyltransferase [Eilatimonas milleporae]